ncbi:flagellar hook assembly protein FlgD [Acetobacter pasteurianus]|uniref:flagellar hook assembly protein FlgD n=1 Tax=Acetobacter pasteurianus TaxID=438 RepID=UPI0013635E83|nr:flagellar hook capping FlgD N-terminal domain-containing protein [Acetobacter pasteurianus]QHM90224.1 flagellar hook capping FlgD N-terminal domain-containing protein [Acetobacter pasteurianus]
MSTTATTSSTSQLASLLQASESAAKTGATSISTAGSSGTSTASTASAGAFASLATNESNFLTLLTTQLKNQDPSSPMDTNAMTSELATFAGVEQQVQTNQNLESLISLNEEGQLTSDKALVGEKASASSSTLPLQSGKASLTFTGTSGEVVAISVANAAGQVVKDDLVSASNGSNTWSWDGTDNSGNQLSDGAYSVAVKTMNSSGVTSDVSFAVNGTITGITKGSTDMEAEMGEAEVPLSSVSSISASS